jgi:gliding motility-associated-like protein
VTDGCTTPAVSHIFTLYVVPAPTVNFTTDTNFVCANECIIFTDASVVQPGSVNTYNWTFSDGSSDTGTQVQKCFPNAGTFDVSLNVTSNNGCSSTLTINNAVTAGAVPEVDFTYTPENPTDIEPLVTFQNTSLYSDTWTWNFGDGSILSFDQNPVHTFPDTGIYCVTLHASNIVGCNDSSYKCLRVEPEMTVYIPNSFTPDGDSHNEVFKVVMSGAEIEYFEMRIFNRWGNQLYFTNDPLAGWDGKGEEGNGIDTYVYRIVIKDIKGYEREYLGHVNIIR